MKLHQKMHVVWHDHRIAEIVAHSVEIEQRVQNDAGDFRLGEFTCAMPVIQKLVELP